MLCLEIRDREISKSGPCSQEVCSFSEKKQYNEGHNEVQVQRLKHMLTAEMEGKLIGDVDGDIQDIKKGCLGLD